MKRAKLVNWQYCKDPNDINKAIMSNDPNWEGLESADQIISISYDTMTGIHMPHSRQQQVTHRQMTANIGNCL